MVRVHLPVSSLRGCHVGIVDLSVIESAEHFLSAILAIYQGMGYALTVQWS